MIYHATMHQPMWDSTTSPTSHNQTTKPGRVGTLETHPQFWIKQNKTRIGQTSFIKPNQTPYSTYPITIPDPRTPVVSSLQSVRCFSFLRPGETTNGKTEPTSELPDFATLRQGLASTQMTLPFGSKRPRFEGFWPLNLEVIWVL